MTPRISIVIAAYNCERYLSQTIGSIQAQTVRDWECVIVDDGSTDSTLDLARRAATADPRFRVVTRPNAGTCAARNHGLTLSDPGSDFLAFMDHDDTWEPRALEILTAELDAHPRAVGAHGCGRCIDQDGNPLHDPAYVAHGGGRIIYNRFGQPVRLADSAPTSFRSIWYSNPFPPGLILGRRSAYEKAGPFDPGAFPVEDWDILIRLCRHGHLRFVPGTILSYRRHSANYSGRSATLNARKWRYLVHKTFFSERNKSFHRRILRKNWRALQLFHFRRNVRAVAACVAGGRFGNAGRSLASLALSVWRFARGYPTVEGI